LKTKKIRMVMLSLLAHGVLVCASAATPAPSDSLSQLADPRGLINPVYRWNANVIKVQGKPSESDIIDNDYATAKYGKPWNFDRNTYEGIKFFSKGILNRRIKDGKLMFQVGKRAYFYWGNFREGDNFKEEDIRFNRKPAYFTANGLKCRAQVRLKQSMKSSTWKIIAKMGDRNYLRTANAKVTGNEWQTIDVPIETPYPGKISALVIFPGNPGNEVEIDSIKIVDPYNNSYVRKKIVLDKKVKNVQIAFITANLEKYRLYINGQMVSEGQHIGPNRAVVNSVNCGKYFKQGENAIAYSQSSSSVLNFNGKIAIEGIIKFKDGSFNRIFTNKSWKGTYKFYPNWMKASFDDAMWKDVWEGPNVAKSVFSLHPENTTAFGLLANPPYLGPIEIKTSIPNNHIFQQNSGVKLNIELPLPCDINYEFIDAFTNKEIIHGNLAGTKMNGKYSSSFFYKPETAGVYNLKISAFYNGQLLDTRFYETVVIGKIPQKQALLKDMESATKLELVDEIYCGIASEKHDFVDGSATINNTYNRSAIINTSEVEKIDEEFFRRPGRRHGDWFSYLFSVKNKYKPHIIEIEFLDNSQSAIVARITEKARKTYLNTGDTKMMRSSASVATGGAFKPLTGKIQKLKVFYIPSYASASIDIINGSHYNNKALPVYRIRVYEIKEMPALKVPYPSGKLFGMMQERYPIAMRAFYGGPAAESFVGISGGMFQHKHFGFYKKHYRAIANQIRWMRFCGENLWVPAVWMYTTPTYPTDVIRHPSMPKDDYLELTLRMFGANEVSMMPLFEFIQFSGAQLFPAKLATNEEVARGASTNKIVLKDGTQAVASNICHPDVQQRYKEIIRDFMDKYGRNKSLLGISIYAGPSRNSFEPMVTEFSLQSNDLEVLFDGSYDDITMKQFEDFIGRKIPVEQKDTKRFIKRYKWIKDNARKEFIDFRCKKLAKLHCLIRDEVLRKHPGKQYWPIHFVPAANMLEAANKKGFNTRETFRLLGIDPMLYKRQDGMLAGIEKRTPTYHFEGMNNRCSEAKANFRQESDDFHKSWDNGDNTLFFLRNGFDEIMTTVPKGKKWHWGPWNASKIDLCLNEAHRYFARYMTNCLLKTTPKVIISGGIQDELLSLLGHYDWQWQFAAPFRSIPMGEYRSLTDSGLDKNIVVRLSEKEGKYNFYVANPYWWETDVNLAFSENANIKNLVDGTKTTASKISFRLPGYGVEVFTTSVPPISAQTKISEEGKKYLTTQFDILDYLKKITDTDLKQLRLSLSREKIVDSIKGAKNIFQAGDGVGAINILNQPDLIELRDYCRKKCNSKKVLLQDNYRVNCGYLKKYVDKKGNVWLPDQPWNKGVEAYGFSEVSGTTIDRKNTGRKFLFPDHRIYTTERYGFEGYFFRVPNGTYTVRFHTMEGFKPNNKVYDPAICINGEEKIKPYYIFEEVGFDKPLIKEAKGIKAKNGLIEIKLDCHNSRIGGIEIIKENNKKK
jgi:malectin (di-glucose binding ER protein)